MSLEGAYIDFLSEIKNEIVKEVKLEVARRSQDPVLHVFDHENNTIIKPARATAPGSSALPEELPILDSVKAETKPLPPGQPFPDKQSSKFLDDILGTWEGGKK